MRLFLLPFTALALTAAHEPKAAKEPVPDTPVAAANAEAEESRPCDGEYPVFNPEGCPEPELTIEAVEPEPEPEATMVVFDPGKAEECGDRIEQVREERAQPRLQREPASAENPLLIAAVDHSIDECSVLVMHSDNSDIRSIPEASDTVERIPAGEQE